MFQLIAAVFPGTSRSGATIIGAFMIGVSRAAAAESTFLLAVPVMFWASAVKLVDFGQPLSATEGAVLLTEMLVAFLVSLAAIQFLLAFFQKHNFRTFGRYRIFLDALVVPYLRIAAQMNQKGDDR